MASTWHEMLSDNDMGYRDYLAVDRTRFANERTMLAYLRTGLNSLIAGVSFIKFFDSLFFQVAGLLLVSAGFIISIIGLWKFAHMHKLIESLTKVKYTEVED